MSPVVESILLQTWANVEPEVKELLKDPDRWIVSKLKEANEIGDLRSSKRLVDLLEFLINIE